MAGHITTTTVAQGQQATVYHQRPVQNEQHLKAQSSRRRRNNIPKHTSTTFRDDENQTLALQSCLESQGNHPSDEENSFRSRALQDLELLLNRWATSMRPFQSKNLQLPVGQPNNKWPSAKPKVALIPFGSYRLGVHRSDADLDCLCLSPPTTSRGEFFSSLIKLLKDDERVKQVHAIASAYTPVIKFVFQGIHIDLLFARLDDATKLSQHQSIVGGTRVEYQIDDADLVGLDEASVRSLNGARVAQSMLQLVPNTETFQITLRVIKEWALVHGLYSNVLGFLGGINWAILVAFICKSHDSKTSPVALLKAFFQTFSRWNWPQPVMLLPPSYQPPQGVLPMTVWNAKTNARDAQCIMPILTPCYPSMNSSYNVGVPQLRRMQIEFSNASQVLDRIENRKANWQTLFDGNDFFQQHIHFLQVNITAEDASLFVEWFRFCESRLRLLIAGMEAPEYGVHVFPFAKFFHQRYDERGLYLGPGNSEPNCRQTASFFLALRFAYGVETVDLRFCTSEFLHIVNTWEQKRPGMDLTIELVRQADLPLFTTMEENKVTPERSVVTNEELVDVTDDNLVPRKANSERNYATVLLQHVASPLKRART